MKLVTQSNARFSSLKIQLILLFVTINTFAQTFDPDDLPPEFGLGDDPEPGAPIDFMIPVSIIAMFITLAIYFYKHREVASTSKNNSNSSIEQIQKSQSNR